MKRFMAMLSRNKHKDPPPTKLLDLAGQLCRDLQSSFPNLEKLVGAVMRCKQKMHFLTNIHVVRACVFVHIRNGQHDTACRLLEVGMFPICRVWSIFSWCPVVEGVWMG